jgi:hypothetical protein
VWFFFFLAETYMFDSPFRWNLTHEHHLGSLLKGEKAFVYPMFYKELLDCAVRTLAFAGDSDIYFVGRSPESLFDFLSGILYGTDWCDRLTLLSLSMRFREEKEIIRVNPSGFDALKGYFENVGLHPNEIAAREKSVAFVDLVLTGDTFGRLISVLKSWSEEIGVDWNSVKRRIRLIGITQRTKTSPNAWRWQHHCDWINLLKNNSVKNVSVSRSFWGYLGDYQDKVSRSYTPENWGKDSFSSPSYLPEQLKGLRLAYEIFNKGKHREMRLLFASQMVKEKEMKESWFRDLVLKIKAG